MGLIATLYHTTESIYTIAKSSLEKDNETGQSCGQSS